MQHNKKDDEKNPLESTFKAFRVVIFVLVAGVAVCVYFALTV